MSEASQGVGGAAADRPRRLQQIAAFGALFVLYLFSGYCLQALPVAAPAILREWDIAARELATPLALNALGTGVGAVVGGFLGDARGRKFPIMVFTTVQVIAMVFCVFTTGPGALYPLTFAIGLGIGGYFASGMALLTELLIIA